MSSSVTKDTTTTMSAAEALKEKQRQDELLAAAGIPIEQLGKKQKSLFSSSLSSQKDNNKIDPTTRENKSTLYVGNMVPANLWGFAPLPPKDSTPELIERINSTTNKVHSALDIAWACSAYGLSTMMVFQGQSTMFSFASMWGAGTYLFALSQLRHVRGPEPEIWQGELQSVALWFLASFRQFREYKTLKWCGYASWMGLSLSSYYAVRALAATMEGSQNYRREFE